MMMTRINLMNWTTFLVTAAIVAVIFIIKKSSQISAKDALEKLKNGALVIDVRSPGEFDSGHLAKAINIPLDEIETALPTRVKDKSAVLLLHCASGMRSGMAKGKLKGLGYTNVFNLGSLPSRSGRRRTAGCVFRIERKRTIRVPRPPLAMDAVLDEHRDANDFTHVVS